jgi:diguanylate cyclase (GGDEF)-like protein
VRERLTETVLGLLAGPPPRSRADAVRAALCCTLELVDAGAALASLLQGRRLRRSVQLRGSEVPQELPSEEGASDLARYLAPQGRPYLVANTSLDPRFSESLDGVPGVGPGPAVFVPLRLRAQDIGYLAAYREAGQPAFGRQDAHTLMLVGAWLSLVLENARLAHNLEKLAVTDELTQVFNYRFLKTALRREIRRAARFRQDLSVIMLDVDNLKTYNDQHGHLRGSFLLRELAGLLTEQVRSWDLVAKYGGDEFTLILPQTDRAGALTVAERLRSAVEAHTFPLARPGEITISLGVAVFPEDAPVAASLIEMSDKMLYVAKQRGRNCVAATARGEGPGGIAAPGTAEAAH